MDPLVNGSSGEKAETVRIFGEEIPVKASIHTLGGFSAHAGEANLMKWVTPYGSCKSRVVLTHGEDRGRQALGAKIRDELRLATEFPKIGDAIAI